MTDDPDNDAIPLAAAIETLRNEIMTAQQSALGPLRFEVGPIEVEFNIVAKHEGGGKAGFKFGILGIGANFEAGGKIASERTQKVKFTLTPHMIDPTDGLRKPADVSRRPGEHLQGLHDPKETSGTP